MSANYIQIYFMPQHFVFSRQRQNLGFMQKKMFGLAFIKVSSISIGANTLV